MMCGADGTFVLQTCLWEACFFSSVCDKQSLFIEEAMEVQSWSPWVPLLQSLFRRYVLLQAIGFQVASGIPYKIVLFHIWQKNYIADPLC